MGRDKAFLRLKKEMITSIQFYYPADSSFILTKKERGWWIGSEQADSLKVNNYISQLELKNATTFADNYLPGKSAEVTIQLKGKSGLLASVEAWKRTNDWALKSSWQPTIYFSSDQTGIVKSLFESKKNMLNPD